MARRVTVCAGAPPPRRPTRGQLHGYRHVQPLVARDHVAGVADGEFARADPDATRSPVSATGTE
jgi:hypothetical protein